MFCIGWCVLESFFYFFDVFIEYRCFHFFCCSLHTLFIGKGIITFAFRWVHSTPFCMWMQKAIMKIGRCEYLVRSSAQCNRIQQNFCWWFFSLFRNWYGFTNSHMHCINFQNSHRIFLPCNKKERRWKANEWEKSCQAKSNVHKHIPT